ncbi:MAG: GIY-YIG nuclease family protein [Nitrospiraceae bacterium]|nr:GIY-YIG nuclease family protein [Nitrospiraceae bacterium]
MKSGIYLVTLNNEDPISVNAHDPRIADRCIRVNHLNCKIGKAKNLERRKKNYFKTFGEENVNFRILVRLLKIEEAEYSIKSNLKKYRIKGNTGRPNEWLENILPEDVIRTVIQTLKVLEKEGRISIHSWGDSPEL